MKYYHGQLLQDKWLESYIDSGHLPKKGSWLEIGAGHPLYISNTYILERDHGWRGVSIDANRGHVCGLEGASDKYYYNLWNTHRRSPLYIIDALEFDYGFHLIDKAIDYLSLDIDHGPATMELSAKLLSLFSFRAITIEHDEQQGQKIKEPLARLLIEHGYHITKQCPNDAQEFWCLKK